MVIKREVKKFLIRAFGVLIFMGYCVFAFFGVLRAVMSER